MGKSYNNMLSSSSADVDECEAATHQCNPTQVCVNTAGGYTCSCSDGYVLFAGRCQGG